MTTGVPARSRMIVGDPVGAEHRRRGSVKPGRVRQSVCMQGWGGMGSAPHGAQSGVWEASSLPMNRDGEALMLDDPDRSQDVPDRAPGHGDRQSDAASLVANVLVATTMALLVVALLAIVVLR